MTVFDTPIPRDRWQRPLITPPEGGKPVAYTRCTTFVDPLDDKTNLTNWKVRMAIKGAASSPSIVKAAKLLDPDTDKSALDDLAKEALTKAGAGDKATDGTTLHRLTELIDTGQPLPAELDDATLADLEAYRAGTAALTMVEAETFVVVDDLKVAGTFDRLVDLGGTRYIADLKTGKVGDFSIGKIAMQLAVYAHGLKYNPDTYDRTEHGASTQTGIVIHLPAGEARCDLYWVNLADGWYAAHLARDVRNWRDHAKMKHLAAPLTTAPAAVA